LLCGHLRIIIADTNVDMQRDIAGYSVRDTQYPRCGCRRCVLALLMRCGARVMRSVCQWRAMVVCMPARCACVWQRRRVSAGWQYRALRCQAAMQRAVHIAGVSAIIMQRVSQHSASAQWGSDIRQAHTLTSQMTAYAVRVMMCSSLHSEMVDEMT